MRADLFYQNHAVKVVPLSLISATQWEKGVSNINTVTHNFLSSQQFTGKPGDVCLVCDSNGSPAMACIGTGEGNQALAMAHAASKLPAGNYVCEEDLSPFAMLTWALSQYRFDRYKKNDVLPRVLILDHEKLEAVKIEASAVFLVRDLINTPSNDMGPKELAMVVSKMADQWGASFEEYVGEELLNANFPAIHMVGRAAVNVPRLLSLTWGKPEHPRVTLVGKGVCFDSGGLNIKIGEWMRLMKKDMGGAANVLGLAEWIMANRLPIQLRVLIPAVENVIGPEAFKPGDILTMRNGLTVEIDNTDAEGRLVLADALVKAAEDSPELIIDFATLTGAARVAVGTEIAAMFTNDDSLALSLAEASSDVCDPVWRMPLFASYEPMFASSVADMTNSSPSSYAGAITAALFLQRFVPARTTWVHFDIMAWNLSSKPGKPEGGEAMGIRTIAHYLKKKYS